MYLSISKNRNEEFQKLQNAHDALERAIAILTAAWAETLVGGIMEGRQRFPIADLQVMTADLQRVSRRLARAIEDGIGKEGFNGMV